MGETFKPTDAEGVRQAVEWAAAENKPLEVLGRGSKRRLGRPMQTAHTLDLSGLTGVIDYEPAELVITVRAGTPMTEIETLLAEQNQMFAFEPMDIGPLMGGPAAMATVGGMIATNLSGPRRFKAGASRDHLLGFSGINGRGEEFKAGGKVVKNVTGYDMCKLMCGSYGTLTALTELSIKVLPRPEKTYTVLVRSLNDPGAVLAMTEALNSPLDISGAVHLPKKMTPQSSVSYVRDSGTSLTALRLEGPGPSVEARCKDLREKMSTFGETEELHSQNSLAFWQEIRDVRYFVGKPDRAVWRISVAPSEAPSAIQAIRYGIGGKTAAEMEHFMDWGGGQVWVSFPAGVDAAAGTVRGAFDAAGGHATLVVAEDSIRNLVPVFNPQPEELAELTRRVKESFDPKGILNPGRIYAGL